MPIFLSKHKKLILTLILIILISSLGIFVLGVGEAKAAGWLSAIFGDAIDIGFEALAWIITRIGTIILSIVSLLFWLGAMLLEIAFGLEKFTDAGVVQMGWKITRDLANMFFVLILLTIAFATILRIETYGMKALLPKLIMVALLINFSLVLAGVIIDFSQVLTHFFYDQVTGTAGFTAQIAKAINVQKTWELNPEANIPEKIAGGISGVIMVIFSIFLGIVLLLCATLALGIGAFFLIVRLIALWILLILAPIAWFLGILPATAHLFKQWWNTFLKWTFFAPIYIFFVYLAVKAAEGGSFAALIQTETENIINASGFKETIGNALAANARLLLQFICVMGLLFGGLIAAQKMGVYGAQGAMGMAKFFGKGAAGLSSRWLAKRRIPGVAGIGKGMSTIAGKLRKRMPGLAARLETAGKIFTETKGRGALSPGAWQRAWTKRRQRAEAESYSEGVGSLEDILDYAYSGGKEYNNRQYRATLGLGQQKLKELKETGDTSQPQLINTVKAGIRKGGIGGKAEVMAAMWQLFAQGDEEGLMGDKELGELYGYKTDPVNIQRFIKKHIGEGDNEKRFAGSLGNIARLAGIPQYDGMVETDPATGQMEWTDEGKIGVTGAIQASKIWSQNKARILGRRTYGVEDETTGKFDRLHTASRELLRRISTEDVNEVKNISTHTKQWLVEGEKRDGYLQKFADEIEKGYATDYKTEEGTKGYAPNKQKAEILRRWIGKLEEQMPGKSEEKGPEDSRITPSTGETFREARGKHRPGAFG